MQGNPLLCLSSNALSGRTAAAVLGHDLRFQATVTGFSADADSPGDQDGPDRPLMGEMWGQ